jgi:hypothetical protein
VLPRVSAPVRAAALRRLGEARLAPASSIRALYAREDDPDVQAAIVYAVGLVGEGTDVPWLAARLGNLRLWREACFGLARVRDERALGTLAGERRRLAALGEEARDSVALLDYLLGSGFAEAERAAGRSPAGPAR